MRKRMLAMLMCIVMLVSMLPQGTVLAEPDDRNNTSVSGNTSGNNSQSQNESQSQNQSQDQNQNQSEETETTVTSDTDTSVSGDSVSEDSISDNSISENEVDERTEDIQSSGDLCFVAFYVDNKRVGDVIYTKKSNSISYNVIPNDPEGNFIGWYEFGVEKDKDENVTVKETNRKWDKTIPITGNLRLEAKFSNLQIDNSAAMNPIVMLDTLPDNYDLWLVKKQRVSSNEILTTTDKTVMKRLSTKKFAQAKSMGKCKLNVAGKTVNVTVTKPKLEKKQAKMYVGEVLEKADWEYEPDAAHYSKIFWKSSNINIARVNDGKIYAVGKGTATIYAYIGGQKYSTKVTVKDRAVENMVLPYNINIKKSKTIKIMGVKASKATWTIEPGKEGIVTVSKKGKIKAGATTGTALLTCEYEGSKYYRMIYVENPRPMTDDKLTYNSSKKKYRLFLNKGEGYVIKVDKNDVAQNILWTSNATAKVYVDETGLVVARKDNCTAILSTKVNGKTVKIYVTVAGEKKPEKEKPAVCFDLREADPPVIPDDGIDDTGAINAAIQNMKGELAEKYDNTIYLGPGTYNIAIGKSGNPQYKNCAIHFDYDNSNITFVMSPNAKLVVAGNGKDDYSVFKFSGNQDGSKKYAENIKISGGQLCGERGKHKGPDSDQGGHGIVLGSYCRYITIEDMVIKDNNGDGIYVGGSVGKTKNITIKDCEIKNNRRSNISLVWGDDITIEGCDISEANGHPPMAGINIEPNIRNGAYNTDVQNVTVKDCTVKAGQPHLTQANPWSYYFAFLVLDLDATSYKGSNTASGITVENCNFEGDFYNGSGTGMRVKNCKINGDYYDKRGASLENTEITGKKTIR